MKGNQKNKFKISKDVMMFAKTGKKKYVKKYADPYLKKKKQEKEYYDMLFDNLPEVIYLLVRYPNVEEVKQIKKSLINRMFRKKMVKKIAERLEADIEIKNIELLPLIIYDVLKNAATLHEEEKKTNPDAKPYDLSDLVNLSNQINSKKMKKLQKSGISAELAFDCLSVMPTSDLMKEHKGFHIRQLMNVVYTHASTEELNIQAIAKYVVTRKHYPLFITYLLLEKKSDYVNMDDKQKEFFNKVTTWIFNTMENDLDKVETREILLAYFKARKDDKKLNRDSNRRYFLGSLPEDEFPKTTAVINKLKNSDSSIEEFL